MHTKGVEDGVVDGHGLDIHARDCSLVPKVGSTVSFMFLLIVTTILIVFVTLIRQQKFHTHTCTPILNCSLRVQNSPNDYQTTSSAYQLHTHKHIYRVFIPITDRLKRSCLKSTGEH